MSDDVENDELTDDERAFLIEHGGLTAEDLTPEALAEALAFAARSKAAVIAMVRADALSLSQIAAILDQPPAVVLQSVTAGTVYTVAGETADDEPVFPRRQVTEGKVLPYLREVLAALPDDEHPLSIQAFMTTARGELDGRSPVSWLTGGQDPTPVILAADDRSWT